jgi:hypothetical protein
MILEPRIVEVDTDQAAAFFDRDFDFPFHERCLGIGVLADQQRIGIGEAYFVAADLLDVLLAVRIDCFVELKVCEIEVDMLMGFPSAHKAVTKNISAAEADERPRKWHSERNFSTQRGIVPENLKRSG